MVPSQVRTPVHRIGRLRLVLAGAFLLTGIAAPPVLEPGAGLEAQLTQEVRDFHQGMRFGAGYSGVFPDAAVGVSAFMNFPSRRIGLFGDVKMTPNSVTNDPSYCPPPTRPPNLERCTVETVQFQWPVDFPIRQVKEFLIVNAGAFYSITEEFAILAGVGMARRHDIQEFTEEVLDQDPWRVSDTGAYFAPFTEDPEWGAQALVGLLFRAGNNLVFRFGVETAPSGVSVGIYWAF